MKRWCLLTSTKVMQYAIILCWPLLLPNYLDFESITNTYISKQEVWKNGRINGTSYEEGMPWTERNLPERNNKILRSITPATAGNQKDSSKTCKTIPTDGRSRFGTWPPPFIIFSTVWYVWLYSIYVLSIFVTVKISRFQNITATTPQNRTTPRGVTSAKQSRKTMWFEIWQCTSSQTIQNNTTHFQSVLHLTENNLDIHNGFHRYENVSPCCNAILCECLSHGSQCSLCFCWSYPFHVRSEVRIK